MNDVITLLINRTLELEDLTADGFMLITDRFNQLRELAELQSEVIQSLHKRIQRLEEIERIR